MTDPIADYLTRLRNAIGAKHRVVEVPASNLKKEITKILFEKGYILNYQLCKSFIFQRFIFKIDIYIIPP